MSFYDELRLRRPYPDGGQVATCLRLKETNQSLTGLHRFLGVKEILATFRFYYKIFLDIKFASRTI